MNAYIPSTSSVLARRAAALLFLFLVLAPLVAAEHATSPPAGEDGPPIEELAAKALAAREDGHTTATPGILPYIATFNIEGLKAISKDHSLIPVFEKGGPIMWPLLIASILAVGTVIDRLLFLLGVWFHRDRKKLARFFDAIRAGDAEGALKLARGSKDYVLRVLVYVLEHKASSMDRARVFAEEREMERFRRGIPILDTVITLAPLLGLLGTVTGMMGSFSLIGGELGAPGAITGGIAEALIATAFGLGIAISSLLPFNFLNTKSEHARLEIESAVAQLRLLTQAGRAPSPKRSPAPEREPQLESEMTNEGEVLA